MSVGWLKSEVSGKSVSIFSGNCPIGIAFKEAFPTEADDGIIRYLIIDSGPCRSTVTQEPVYQGIEIEIFPFIIDRTVSFWDKPFIYCSFYIKAVVYIAVQSEKLVHLIDIRIIWNHVFIADPDQSQLSHLHRPADRNAPRTQAAEAVGTVGPGAQPPGRAGRAAGRHQRQHHLALEIGDFTREEGFSSASHRRTPLLGNYRL